MNPLQQNQEKLRQRKLYPGGPRPGARDRGTVPEAGKTPPGFGGGGFIPSPLPPPWMPWSPRGPMPKPPTSGPGPMPIVPWGPMPRPPANGPGPMPRQMPPGGGPSDGVDMPPAPSGDPWWLSLVKSQMGQTGSGLTGDLNGDGTVDIQDFSWGMANNPAAPDEPTMSPGGNPGGGPLQPTPMPIGDIDPGRFPPYVGSKPLPTLPNDFPGMRVGTTLPLGVGSRMLPGTTNEEMIRRLMMQRSGNMSMRGR